MERVLSAGCPEEAVFTLIIITIVTGKEITKLETIRETGRLRRAPKNWHGGKRQEISRSI